jgi:predicted alpha/beta hydrolase
MMKQWFNWNLKKEFKGKYGFNYQRRMRAIRIPIFSICSAADTFISPESSCKKYLDNFHHSINRYRCFSLNGGHLENYGHDRVLMSRNAVREIWPLVSEWMERFER